MGDRFLTEEEYDERAHRLYDDGDFEGALETLKEGLALYPNAVELCVGLGYARLARDEFAWARRAFERALVLDPGHEDAMVGLGDVLLRLGELEEGRGHFRAALAGTFDDDTELLLTIGRALYREELYEECREVFARAAAGRPESAEAAASLGYVLHRLGDELGASRQVRRALRLSPDMHEARVYLGHLLFEGGNREAALREFGHVPPQEHWDPLGVWRTMELMRVLWGIEQGDPRLEPWETRLRALEGRDDPVEALLAEVEARVLGFDRPTVDPDQLELFDLADSTEVRRVRLPDGALVLGNWSEILVQMRERAGFHHEGLQDFMRRMAERWHDQLGVEIPFSSAAAFLREAVRAGVLKLEGEEEK